MAAIAARCADHDFADHNQLWDVAARIGGAPTMGSSAARAIASLPESGASRVCVFEFFRFPEHDRIFCSLKL